MAQHGSESTSGGSQACRLEVRVSGPDAVAHAERLVAEAWASGIAGLEERDEGGDIVLVLYAPEAPARALRRELEESGVAAACRARLGPVEAVPAVDWSEEWKRDLEAIEIGGQLIVRPSFVASPRGPSAASTIELVIDPGMAFGTGHHPSTRLALSCLVHDLPVWRSGDRVLDVGTGTGILALAAVALGAETAFGLDLDPLAPAEAARWARVNRLEGRTHWLVGPLEAVAGARFACVVANLLRREMEPISQALADAVREGGHLVLSGLLSGELESVVRRFEGHGLVAASRREERDGNGDEWIGLVMRKPKGPRPDR